MCTSYRLKIPTYWSILGCLSCILSQYLPYLCVPDNVFLLINCWWWDGDCRSLQGYCTSGYFYFPGLIQLCVRVRVTRFLLAFLRIMCVMCLPAYGVLILFCLFRNYFIFLPKAGGSAPHGLYQVTCVLCYFIFLPKAGGSVPHGLYQVTCVL